MDLLEAMELRHSVRAYDPRPIESDKLAAMQAAVDECNQESGLHLQLVVNEPKAFDSAMAHYGRFSGVTNYIAVVGKKGGNLEEQCGYYGERLVLEAQRLGLNTCWVGLTFKRIPEAFRVEPGEKLVCVIALGYGRTQGRAHRGKLAQDVIGHRSETADWFERGVEAALLAPTAVNQQKFTFRLRDGVVKARAGRGFFSKVDLGIVKYHLRSARRKNTFAGAEKVERYDEERCALGREASFELDCSRCSDRILEIVKLLNVSGWTLFDEDGQAEYLPLGDRGDYQWELEALSDSRLYELIERKQDRAEMVGLVMYYRDTDVGITLLAENTETIIIMPNINRRTLDDDDDSVTDMSWYAERIILKLMWRGCQVEHVKFEEYEG